jgi:hypothetical protein
MFVDSVEHALITARNVAVMFRTTMYVARTTDDYWGITDNPEGFRYMDHVKIEFVPGKPLVGE